MGGEGFILDGTEDKQTFPTKHAEFSQDFTKGGEEGVNIWSINTFQYRF